MVKMDEIESEVIQIRSEFDNHKSSTARRLQEILDKLEPQFTPAQITTFLLTLVGMFGAVMIYVTNIKSDTRNNTTQINSLKEADNSLKNVDDRREIEYDNIKILLTEISKDVEALNGK